MSRGRTAASMVIAQRASVGGTSGGTCWMQRAELQRRVNRLRSEFGGWWAQFSAAICLLLRDLAGSAKSPGRPPIVGRSGRRPFQV